MKKSKLGQELIQGLQEAIAYERGEITLRTHQVILPDEPAEWSAGQIARLRKTKLNVSQSIFAAYLGVTPSALQAWEQGLKKPTGSARRLLELLDRSHEQIIALMDKRPNKKRSSGGAAA